MVPGGLTRAYVATLPSVHSVLADTHETVHRAERACMHYEAQKKYLVDLDKARAKNPGKYMTGLNTCVELENVSVLVSERVCV